MVVPSSPLSPDSDLVTVEEFYCLVPDGQKADLIDGVIYLRGRGILQKNLLVAN